MDSASDPHVLVATPDGDYAYDWSAEGRYLVFSRCYIDCDIWFLDRTEGQRTSEIRPFVESRADEFSAALSPDARYLAYTSGESGRNEVYVQRFPQRGGKTQISINGGVGPRWRHDGKELFYTEGDWIVAVAITMEPAFSVGPATRLFQDKNRFGTRACATTSRLMDSVSSFETVEEPRPAIGVVQNWFSEFRDRR